MTVIANGSVAPGAPVYTAAGGFVSTTKAAGAFLVGVSVSKQTISANQPLEITPTFNPIA